MKTFFNKKRIVFTTIIFVCLFILIMLLIFPIGSLSHHCLVYSTHTNTFGPLYSSDLIFFDLASPFTFGDNTLILVAQTIIFTLVSIVFVVFSVLFAIELKRAGVLTRRPTKAERLEQRIAELQKQVEELKKDK